MSKPVPIPKSSGGDGGGDREEEGEKGRQGRGEAGLSAEEATLVSPVFVSNTSFNYVEASKKDMNPAGVMTSEYVLMQGMQRGFPACCCWKEQYFHTLLH